MRCLVTGGAGFIGRHVAQALKAAGHETIPVDITESGAYRVDICSLPELRKLFKECHPDVVFHLAATSDARKALADPVMAVNVSIGGTANVLQVSRESGVKRVIITSTCSVCGAMRSGTVDENEPFQHNGAGHIYVTLKIAAELLAHDFQKLYGLSFTILRYGTVYGPGMWKGLVVREFIERALAGEPLIVHDDGSDARRFVYVEDLARAHVLALQAIAENQVYNLEGNRTVTIKELAEIVIRIVGKGHIEYHKADVTQLKYAERIISTSKAQSELGWEPVIDIEEGIKNILHMSHGFGS
jgi:nucleoside-diphosphate-sugar epimerase